MASEKVLYNPTGLPAIVGIYAPTARSGKGTIAQVLTEKFDYVPLKFALPIREMFVGFSRSCGLDQNTIDRCLEGDLKEAPIFRIGGLSYRTFAEGIGTHWGRQIVGEDFWVGLWRTRALELLKNGRRIVVDDVRFENEMGIIKDLGGVTIRVSKPDVKTVSVLEGNLEGELFDIEIENTETVTDLEDYVVTVFSHRSFGKAAEDILGPLPNNVRL